MIPLNEKKEIKRRAISILGSFNSTTDKRRNKLFMFSALKYILKSNRNLLNT